MKIKFVFTAIIFSVLVFVSCNNIDNNMQDSLTQEIIASNLSKKGDSNPELLIGGWDCVKFAYTADGKKFTHTRNISSNYGISMSDFFSYDDERLGVVMFACCGYHYSRINNLINYIKSDCFAVLIPLTDDDLLIYEALKSTYCFVTKGNELIIHFTGIENKNLLILKKR